MSKLSKLSLALLLLAPLLSACHPDPTLPEPGDAKSFGSNPLPGDGFTGGKPVSGENTLTGRVDDMPDDVKARMLAGTLTDADILVSVSFDFDKYGIREDQRTKLMDAAKKMAANPKLHTMAVGHTDWYGSEQYNLGLGDKRSRTVQDFLTKNGADTGHVEINSMGKLQCTPNVGKESPEAKHDRRVDVVQWTVGAGR